MSSSNRPLKVAEAVKREFSDLLIKGEIKDARLKKGLLSITDVNVTNDLRHVKIFVSFFEKSNTTPEEKLEHEKEIVAGLESAKGFVRTELGKRIRLRFTPEISFKLDKSIEKGAQILALMDKIASEEHKDEILP